MSQVPNHFLFSLTRTEIMNLSQFVISSKIKHAPNVFAFTENGIAMLSSVLNSDRAIQVNIAIMRVFTRLREILTQHHELEKKFEEYDKQFKVVFEVLNRLLKRPVKKGLIEPRLKQPIGFRK